MKNYLHHSIKKVLINFSNFFGLFLLASGQELSDINEMHIAAL